MKPFCYTVVMNKETVIISTLERLNERISRLEQTSVGRSRIGVCLGASASDTATEVIRQADAWFDDAVRDLEPSDLNGMAMEGKSLQAADWQINDLANYIKAHCPKAEERVFRVSVKTQFFSKGRSPYLQAEIWLGIRQAMNRAFR